MNPFNWFFGLQEAFAQRRTRVSHPGALSDLGTPIGNTPFWSTNNGSMVSVIEIEGSREYVLAENHEEHVSEIFDALRAYFRLGTTDICWLHTHSDEEASNIETINESLRSLRSVSEIQGYKNSIFIDEMVDVLKNAIQKEQTLLCVWTNRMENHGHKSTIPKLKEPGSQDTANLGYAEGILESHKAKIENLLERLGSAGFLARIMNNHEVGRAIAQNVDPSTNANFSPRLFGQIMDPEDAARMDGDNENEHSKRYLMRAPGNIAKGLKGKDYTCIFPPQIGYQVWNQRPKYESDYVVVGARAYASIMVTLAPDSPIAFEDVVKNLKRQGVPFRMSQYCRSKSRAALIAKFVLATLLKKVPGNNAMLHDAISQVLDFEKKQGVNLSLQMTFTVWAPSDDIPLLKRRIEQTLKSINTWGAAQAQLMGDDSLFGFVSTLGPYRSRSVAPASVGPAEDVLYLAPITRPALPWKEGGVPFRSPTGKLLPFQPLSDELTHHVYLVCGEPGYGKSLLCQIIMIAIAETHEILPYIAMSDVGPSSLGTIRYLQSILPVTRKHHVFYCELTNEKRMSINRYDTPLGVRMPLADDFDAMRDWTLLGVSDSQNATNKEGMDALIADAIKLAFERCSDRGPRAEPKRHEDANEDDRFWASDIQPALDRIGVKPTRETTYWQLVDALFDAGEFHAAALVQRFAVPLLDDIKSATRSAELREAHRQEISPRFTLADHAHSRLTNLRDELKISQDVTQFDISECRVTSFNLENVVRNSNTPAAKRIGGLYFGLTSEMQVAPFFWNKERVAEIDKKYQVFHRKRLDEVARTRNIYFADEQQYFTGIAAADRIPDNIATTGRKRGVGVMLSTQLPKYFTSTMRQLSTMRFYCGFQKSSIKEVVEVMSLNEREQWLLENRIKKPGREGSYLLIQAEGEKGVYSQLVNLRVGIRKLWGVSTKSTSSEVRDALTEEFTYEQGLEILSRLFPSGEAESEYERLRQRLSEQGTGRSGLEEMGESVRIHDIVEHIIEKAKERGRAMFAETLREGTNE